MTAPHPTAEPDRRRFLPSNPEATAALVRALDPGGMTTDLAGAIGQGPVSGTFVAIAGHSALPTECVQDALAREVGAASPGRRLVVIGEMRSTADAMAAVKALAEGYSVLSVVHAPSAARALRRLHILAPDAETGHALLRATTATLSLEGMLHQPCSACRCPWIAAAPLGPCWTCGPGCPACSHVGHHGHVAVMEVLLVDDAVRAAVTNNTDGGDALERLMRPRSAHERMASMATRSVRFWGRDENLRQRVAAGEADGRDADRLLESWWS